MLSYNRGDETIICPYDETHNIQKKSFQAHIIKCREANRAKVKMVVCKFDKTHIVPKPELKHHMKDCPSRSVLDRDIQCQASIGHALTGDVKGPEIKGSHSAQIDEDWDSAPQKVRTQALFNRPVDDFSDEDEVSTYIKPGANYVGKLSPKKPSQPCEESEQVQRKVPLTQSKAAQLSESAQLRTVVGSSTSRENSALRNNVLTASQPNQTALRGTSAYVQDEGVGFARGQSRGLVAAYAPSIPAGQSFGRGVSKYANSLTQPPHQPWGQGSTATHHQSSDSDSPYQPSIPSTPAKSSNSSQAAWSPETFSNVSSDYSSCHEMPAFGFNPMEEMAVQRNKALSARQARELEEILHEHEMEHQQLVHKQEQERLFLLQRHEKERALAFEEHEQFIRQLLLVCQQGRGDVLADHNPGLVSGLELLSLGQQSNVSLPSPNGRNEMYPGAFSPPGSLSYARVLSTKSEAFSDNSDVQSVSWCVEETDSDVSGKVDGSIPERLVPENLGDSTSNCKDYSKMTNEEIKQKKKKLEKKLKQIRSIEERIYRGETILPDEETKLKRKTSILKDLETIAQNL